MTTLTDAEILAVPCPECLKPAGVWCVYRPIAGVDPGFAHYRSAKVQARLSRVGTPTQRPHHARVNLASERRRRRLARERLRERQITVTPASETARASARAEIEFDRIEHLRLRAWLAAHASILINATRSAD